MSDYTQAQLELLAHQELTHPGTIVGTPVDVSSALSGVAYVWLARIETTADLVAGLDYIDLQISPDATGNNWVSYLQLAPETTASASVAVATSEDIGSTVIEVGSTTGFDASDLIYIKAAAGIANSEWCEVASIVASTSINLVDGLLAAKAQNDVIYDRASRWKVFLDFAGVMRVRAVVKHQGATGSDWRVKAVLEVATDIE